MAGLRSKFHVSSAYSTNRPIGADRYSSLQTSLLTGHDPFLPESSNILNPLLIYVDIPFSAVCHRDFYEHEYSLCFSRSHRRPCFWHRYLPRARQQQWLDGNDQAKLSKSTPNMRDSLVSCGGKRFNGFQWCPFTITPTSIKTPAIPSAIACGSSIADLAGGTCNKMLLLLCTHSSDQTPHQSFTLIGTLVMACLRSKFHVSSAYSTNRPIGADRYASLQTSLLTGHDPFLPESSNILNPLLIYVDIPFSVSAVCHSDFYEHEYSLCFSRSHRRPCFWHRYLPRARQQQWLDGNDQAKLSKSTPNMRDSLVSCGGKRFNGFQWCPFTITPTCIKTPAIPSALACGSSIADLAGGTCNKMLLLLCTHSSDQTPQQDLQ